MKPYTSAMMIALLSVATTAGCKTTIPPYAEEARFLSNIRQVTSQQMGLLSAAEGHFSPDGKSLIFQATPMGKEEYQVYTVNLKTGKLRMVSTGKGACDRSYFRPDKEKIIFASSHLDPTLGQPEEQENEAHRYDQLFNEHMDLFEANLDGSDLKRLTDTPGYDAECTFSPDGRCIVFCSSRDGDKEIYTISADGTDPKRITFGEGYDGGPSFSPDGTQIIYRGDRRNDGKMNLQLRLVNSDGTDDHAITDNALFNWSPCFHPSGKSIIFTQADHRVIADSKRPEYDLFLTTPEGNRFQRITFDPAWDGLPAFSPDGKYLVWSSRRNGAAEPQLFIAEFTLPEGFE